MMNPRRTSRSTAGAWLLASCMVAAGLLARPGYAAEPPPVADFFRSPRITGPVMSPSGRYVAATMAGGPDARQRLVIVDLQDLSKSKVIAAFADADIRRVDWVNEDRLVFTLTDLQSPYAEQLGQGLFGVDRDGGQTPRRLIKTQWDVVRELTTIEDRQLSAGHRLHTLLRDGSNDVIVARPAWDLRGEIDNVALLRLDTQSGRSQVITGGAPEHTVGWAVDRAGRPRVAVIVRAGKYWLSWKPSPDTPWTAANQEGDQPFAGIDRGLSPIGWGRGDALYASARLGSDDTRSMVRVDLTKGAAEVQPVLSLKGYDFEGRLVLGPQGDLLGVHYLTDARGTAWFDPGWKNVQARVDGLLPGTVNQIDCGDCNAPARVLVSSSSDRQPPVHRLFDVKTGALELMAAERPWIDPKAMATRDFASFKARDGLAIPVHVTRPVGKSGPAPAVVLVHGGPYVRGGEWAWDADTQFLASRGYAVIEPEFRGSTGFGRRHFVAGWKQWGLAMQEDIADATTWAIKQGFADEKRICIAGPSYGGYATLMGLIRFPELYRCGVEWVGVTDIDLLYSIDWSDMSAMWKEYGMPRLVGDRKADAKQLAETSPLKLAARLTQPLLMAYGGLDLRVPIEHGTKLRNALKPHNPNVEWIEYPDEGHGWMLEAHNVDFWSKVERFLQRNLKAGQ